MRSLNLWLENLSMWTSSTEFGIKIFETGINDLAFIHFKKLNAFFSFWNPLSFAPEQIGKNFILFSDDYTDEVYVDIISQIYHVSVK